MSEMRSVRAAAGLPAVQPGRQASRAEVRQEGGDPAGRAAEQAEATQAGEAVRSASEAAAGGPAATGAGFRVELELPIQTVSEANQREHYMAKARRAKTQRMHTCLLLRHQLGRCVDALRDPPAIRITLTRLGVRKLDKDNLAGSLKHVQDGVADWLGIDDGSTRLTWDYAQETGRRYAVRVCIEHD